MYRLITTLVLTFYSLLSYSANINDSLLNELENTLKIRDRYFTLKTKRIDSLTHQFNQVEDKGNYVMEYDLCMKLFNEYESFTYDSAYNYIEKAQIVASQLKDVPRIAMAKIKTGFVLLSSGLFKESLDTLLSIRPGDIPDSIKYQYYSTIARTYYDLADYVKGTKFSEVYNRIGNQYLDKAIVLVNSNSNEYWYCLTLRKMKGNEIQEAARDFEYWIQHSKLTEHEYAIAASSLGYIYTLLGQNSIAEDLLIKASIADIKSSTKETVALRNLSDLIYKRGDTKTAYRYIKLAMDDATFYNARHRKIEIAKILPIIEGEKLNIVEKQKSVLEIYAVLITVLIIVVLIFAYVIFKQLRKLKQAKYIIQEINLNLMGTNNKLMEANRIKEEYIGYFFNINSEFIEKMASFQKAVHRKVVARQYDDLDDIIKTSSLKEDRENLFRNFDKIFLKLFPNFVNDFNTLFEVEDRIILKSDELLTPDLRIFALMRLGIKDNEKIAKFLDYSVTTIYTYKTKIKSKSLYRDQFDEKIMEIRAVK
ncbi:MAG TPA: DUF6377 domain-containing protein [Bacteroidales bacterium]